MIEKLHGFLELVENIFGKGRKFADFQGRLSLNCVAKSERICICGKPTIILLILRDKDLDFNKMTAISDCKVNVI